MTIAAIKKSVTVLCTTEKKAVKGGTDSANNIVIEDIDVF